MNPREQAPFSPAALMRRGILGIVLAVAIAFLVPVAAPLIGLLMLAGGIIFRRRNPDPTVKRLCTLYIAAGSLLVVIPTIVLTTQIAVH